MQVYRASLQAPPPINFNWPSGLAHPVENTYLINLSWLARKSQLTLLKPQAGVGIPMQAPANVATATAPFQPVFMQPFQQPVMMQGGAAVPGGHVVGQPVTAQSPPVVVAGNIPSQPTPVHCDPVLGIGRTQGEIAAEQRQFAEANNLFQPQDFKPSDDDPSRYYMVREVDGVWTQRNRLTIDSLGCRWYLADEGYFYAVRLSD